MTYASILILLLLTSTVGCIFKQNFYEVINLDFEKSDTIKVKLVEKRWETERLLITVSDVGCDLTYEYFMGDNRMSTRTRAIKKDDDKTIIYDTEFYGGDLILHLIGNNECRNATLNLFYKYY